jgi:hypothetical protein
VNQTLAALSELPKHRSPYVKKDRGEMHVIVMGHLNHEAMSHFFEEFFHPNHKGKADEDPSRAKIVLFTHAALSPELGARVGV